MYTHVLLYEHLKLQGVKKRSEVENHELCDAIYDTWTGYRVNVSAWLVTTSKLQKKMWNHCVLSSVPAYLHDRQQARSKVGHTSRNKRNYQAISVWNRLPSCINNMNNKFILVTTIMYDHMWQWLNLKFRYKIPRFRFFPEHVSSTIPSCW